MCQQLLTRLESRHTENFMDTKSNNSEQLKCNMAAKSIACMARHSFLGEGGRDLEAGLGGRQKECLPKS